MPSGRCASIVGTGAIRATSCRRSAASRALLERDSRHDWRRREPSYLHGCLGGGGGEVTMARIALVNDDPDLSESCANVLRRSGHEVLTCIGRAEALERIPSWRPELLILDLQIGG